MPTLAIQPDTITIPAFRFGTPYMSLDLDEVRDLADGTVRAHVGRVNAGLVRRDLRDLRAARRALAAIPVARMLEICRDAADQFVGGTLTLGGDGAAQSPDQYIATLSATSGLPHTLVRANMSKLATVLREMESILRGLTRGLDLAVLDTGIAEQAGVAVSYTANADALGVVLPSNSPTVNSIWMPAIALKMPVVLKPGRDEPWTPLRLIAAFVSAGCPAEAFGFYPTDHEGASTIMECCGRSIIFGDERTMAKYAGDPAINLHGPGRSKVLIGPDLVDDWETYLDVLVDSVVYNGGRACINASSIFVPRHADAIADALAARVAAIEPTAPDDPEARLSAIANPAMAAFMDNLLNRGFASGAADVTARHRTGPTRVERDGRTYMRPVIARVDDLDNPLARTELLFPFCSVVEVPAERLVDDLGPSLVVTAITKDPGLRAALLDASWIDRLNLGPVATCVVKWDQPHEGNLFEHLYTRRSIRQEAGW